MPKFNTHERSSESTWLIEQIKLLIYSAKKLTDSSLVIYAALETRNLFERIEFDLLAMAAKGTDTDEFLKGIRGKTGIQQTNKKYKILKYRYQSFSSALTKAIFEGANLKTFSYDKSEKYCTELSQYIHTYSRLPEDLIFGSEFIASGIQLVEECLEYLMTDFFQVIDGHLAYGVFDFDSLTPPARAEFEKWLNGVNMDEQALLERLIALNHRENDGIRTTISFKDDENAP